MIKFEENTCKTIKKYVKLISVIIPISICFLLMLYIDNTINAEYGYKFCSSILEGNFKQFFNEFDWSYGFLIYTIYAVWSIPVWIIYHISRATVNLQIIPVLLWYKTLLVAFAGWSIYLVKKIAVPYTDKKIDTSLLYASSQLFVFPIFAIAQCDIIGLCFVLLGIYYYMQDRKIPFFVSFGIALDMKYFALFIFIPLVLLEYKQIKNIIEIGAGTLLLLLIRAKLIGLSDMANAVAADENYYINGHIRKFADISVDIGLNNRIGLWIFFYCILCVIAYLMPKLNETEKNKWATWFSLTGYMLFFLFYPVNVYWYVLLVPFFILVFLQKKELLHLNLILELLFSACVLVESTFDQDWVFLGRKTFSYLFLNKYGHAVQSNALIYYTDKLFGAGVQDYLPIIMGLIYACGILIIVINCPFINLRVDKNIKYSEINFVQNFRVLILYLWILLAVLCLADSQNEYYFDGYTQIDFDQSQVIQNNKRCEFIGNYKGDANGAWISNGYEIIVHNNSDNQEAIKVLIKGFSKYNMIQVYIDDEYYGRLSTCDAGLYIDIDKEKLKETRDYHVVLKSDACVDDALMFCDYINVEQMN